MSRMLVGVWMLALAGCALSEERYLERAPDALCAFYQSCDPPFYRDDAGCREEVEGDIAPPDPSCVYDDELAADCLDALESRTCEGSATNIPGSCAQVYACE